MPSRRKARELAFSALYQADTHQDKGEESLKNFWEDKKIDPETRSYTENLISGVFENMAELDKILEKSSNKWKVSRMPRVDRNILRVAIFEMNNFKLPGKIVINEAVELGKRFGSENSPSFINGVLDQVLKLIEQ